MAGTLKSTQDNAVAQFWNSQAAAFDTIYSGRKNWLARKLDHWLRADMYQRFEWAIARGSAVAPGGSVCDIGCGSGRFVEAYARRGVSRVVGIDVAPEMIALAARLVAAQNIASDCEFRTGDILTEASDESFDVTLAIGLWDYIGDPGPRLKVIRRMTRKCFLSTWPRLWTWRVLQRKARLALRGCPVHFYRRSQVEQLLQSAGFKITSIKVMGKLYAVEARPA